MHSASLSHTNTEKFGKTPKQELLQGQSSNIFLASSIKQPQHSLSLKTDTRTHGKGKEDLILLGEGTPKGVSNVQAGF